MAELIKKHFLEAKKVLDEFIDNEQNFHLIEQAGNMMVDAVKADSKIISCGNGGSMTDAMHFAEELTGRFRETRPAIPAIAISDPSHITCAANDFGFNSISIIIFKICKSHWQKRRCFVSHQYQWQFREHNQCCQHCQNKKYQSNWAYREKRRETFRIM